MSVFTDKLNLYQLTAGLQIIMTESSNQVRLGFVLEPLDFTED